MSARQGFAHIILIVILAVTLAIFGLAYFKSLQTTPYTSPNQAQVSASTGIQSATYKVDDITNWKTYSDTVNKFSFKYPDNLKQRTDENGLIHFTTVTGDPTDFYIAEVAKYTNEKNPPTIIKRLFGNSKPTVTKIGNIEISKALIQGHPDLIYTSVISHKEQYVVAVFVDGEDIRSKESFLNQILSTFKFLD